MVVVYGQSLSECGGGEACGVGVLNFKRGARNVASGQYSPYSLLLRVARENR